MTVLVRALVSWLLALGFALLAVAVAACLFFGNFVVAWQSFSSQGWEQTALGRVPLLGAWAEGFGVGRAPIAALWALVVTGAMNYAIMATTKNLAGIVRAFFDQKQALRSENPAMRARAVDYRDTMIEHSVWAAGLIVFSFLIIRYDVAQFRLRSEGLINGTTDPAEMLRWAPDAVARLGQFFAGFVGTATWGYAGCIIATAIGLEFAIGHAAVRWQTLHNAIEAAVSPDDQDPLRQARDPEPVARPLEDPEGGVPIPVVDSVDYATASYPGALAATDRDPVLPPPPVEPPPAQRAQNEGASVDVIVGPGRTEAFPLADVQAHPERFVRDGSGRVWFTRNYWSQVVSGDGDAGGTQ